MAEHGGQSWQVAQAALLKNKKNVKKNGGAWAVQTRQTIAAW